MPANTTRQTFISELNAFLKYTPTNGDSYTAQQAPTFKKYLDLGANAETVLIAAIKHHCLEIVKLAYEYTVNINNTEFVQLALNSETPDIARFLISRNPNIDLFAEDILGSCIAQNINLLECFRDTIATLDKSARARFVAFCLRKFTRDDIFPLVEKCIQLGIENIISTYNDSPLYSAMVHNYPDIVTALLLDNELNISRALKYRKEFIENGHQACIVVYIETISRVLSNYPSLSKKGLQTAERRFQDALTLALENLAKLPNNAETIDALLVLGAKPSAETFHLFIIHYGVDFFLRVFKNQEKPVLPFSVLCQAINDNIPNIYDIFGEFLQTMPDHDLTFIVSRLFNLFVPETDLNSPYIQTQVLPLMKKCFQCGANVNMIFDDCARSHHTPWMGTIYNIGCRYYGVSFGTITFLQAAMLLNCQPLIKLFLEAGANISVNIPIEPQYKDPFTLSKCANLKTLDLGNAQSKQTYFSTIVEIIPQQELRIPLFNLLQSMHQPSSFFYSIPPHFLLRLAEYLIPDAGYRAQALSQYQRFFKTSEHYFFKSPPVKSPTAEPAKTLVSIKPKSRS